MEWKCGVYVKYVFLCVVLGFFADGRGIGTLGLSEKFKP